MLETLLIAAADAFIAALSFLTTAYIYQKVSILPVNKLYHNKWVLAAASVSVAAVYVFLVSLSSSAASLVSYLFPPFFFVLFEKDNRKLKCIITFLSSTFTRVIAFFPTIIVSLLAALLSPEILPSQNKSLSQLILVLVQILTFILAFFLSKIKRLRKGFQFFQNENHLGIGLVVSGILFVLFGIAYTYQIKSDFLAMIIVAGIAISAFGIYLWIRRSITAHYRERLQLKSEEHYRQLLQEKEQETEKLSQSNAYLAKVVHRDNHLMNALSTSIDAYFESDDPSFRDKLLREMQTLAKERGELIAQEQRDAKILPSTGNLLIDGAINDLYIKAAAHGVNFDLTVSETVDEIIGKYISQTDLQTLLCDHIKDALIAIAAKSADGGNLLVDLSMENGNYRIAVFDSGVDFDVSTLAKLGKERVTTHADSGGSGIGFMTTFDVLQKSYASLIITEFEFKVPFSKSVAVCFDGNHAFMIQSYRKDRLQAALNRDDVIIL